MALSNDRIGPFCGVQTAAVLLDKHPKTIYGWIKAGKLQAEMVGNKLALLTKDVVALAAAEKKINPAAAG